VLVRYVKVAPGSDRPLCPNSGGRPANPEHQLRVRLLDAAYRAADVNPDDLEFTDAAADRMYQALAYGDDVDDRMHLYESSVIPFDRPLTVVTAWFFRCGVCGFVLPATAVER
jgi:hypothetical protein